MTGHSPSRVSAFGHPRVKGCLSPHRGISQTATSFIGIFCHAILRILLNALYSLITLSYSGNFFTLLSLLLLVNLFYNKFSICIQLWMYTHVWRVYSPIIISGIKKVRQTADHIKPKKTYAIPTIRYQSDVFPNFTPEHRSPWSSVLRSS